MVLGEPMASEFGTQLRPRAARNRTPKKSCPKKKVEATIAEKLIQHEMTTP